MPIPINDQMPGTTLFYDAGSGAAVLVRRRGKSYRERQKHFATPLAALEWCIAQRHGFVYMVAADNPATRN